MGAVRWVITALLLTMNGPAVAHEPTDPLDELECAPGLAAGRSAGVGAAGEFKACLASVVEQMTEQERAEALAGGPLSMEQELRAIAVDRVREPELYAEIEPIYSPDFAERAARIPGLSPEQATEKYRLA